MVKISETLDQDQLRFKGVELTEVDGRITACPQLKSTLEENRRHPNQ